MGAQGQARQQAFLVARQLLALHEVVEEEIVHPAARASLVSGPSIVADRHKEEERALVMISELEQFDVDSHEFTTRFRTLQLAVTAHAEAEEAAEFSTLAQRTGPDDAADLLARFRMAQQIDATRPVGLLPRHDGRGPRPAGAAGARRLTGPGGLARASPRGTGVLSLLFGVGGRPAAVNILWLRLPCRP